MYIMRLILHNNKKLSITSNKLPTFANKHLFWDTLYSLGNTHSKLKSFLKCTTWVQQHDVILGFISSNKSFKPFNSTGYWPYHQRHQTLLQSMSSCFNQSYFLLNLRWHTYILCARSGEIFRFWIFCTDLVTES